MKRRGCDDDEPEIGYGDIQTGSVLISDVGPELTKPRRLRKRQFPFGFTAPRTIYVSGANRHRDTARRG